MYRVGVDLGGMTIKAGIVDAAGNIIYKDSCDTLAERENSEILKSMGDLVLSLIEKSDISVNEIESVGVGSPGTVDPDTGVILSAYNLGFENVGIKEALEKQLKLPVYVENDANCAAIAEYFAGNGKGYNSVFLVTVGTGIGGGLVKDGKCDSGAFFSGGEFGHMVIRTKGNPCTCGRLGCFESHNSATALIKELKARGCENMDSILMSLVDGDIEKLSPKVLFEAIEKDCSLSKDIFREYCEYFSDALANYINIFEPEIILIGGGISKQGENFLKDIREMTYKKTFNKKSKVKIETAKFFNDAGIIGASFVTK